MTDRAEGTTVTDHDVPEAYTQPPAAALPVAWQSIVSLVLGIVALLLFGRYGAVGLFAVAFGVDGISRANRGLKSGRGLAIAGIVCGGVGLVLAAIRIAS